MFSPLLLWGARVVETHRGLKIAVDTASRDIAPHIIREGRWEHWVETVVRRLLTPGQTAVEVGANLGYHTLAIGEEIGPTGNLYSFEANPKLCRLLRRTVRMNEYGDRVRLYSAPVTNKPGRVTFDYDRATPGGGHITVGGLGPQERRITVEGITLDETLAHVPCAHMLRMDAEGSEPLVVEGGLKLVDRSPDLAIVSEWSTMAMLAHGVDLAAFVDVLAARGFKAWVIDPPSARLAAMPIADLIGMPHADIVLSRREPQ